jgi:hypothetical protein
VLVSPVIRVHLLDGDTGAYLSPSGLPSTPLQTAPFDLTRRVKTAFAADWEETLDVEEELGQTLNHRAVLIFELLQPPASFSAYGERRGAFPGGHPARLAWGFLKLIRGRDGQPNMGRLQLQLYGYDDRVPNVRQPSGMTPRPGAAPLPPGGPASPPGSPRGSAGPPRVWYAWRAATALPSARRPLYPAHLTVTLAPTPRRDAATALLASATAPAGLGSRPAPRLSASGAPAARRNGSKRSGRRPIADGSTPSIAASFARAVS